MKPDPTATSRVATTPTASEAMDLDRARVLLTGASAGIGAALAPLLAQRVGALVLCGRDPDKLAVVLDTCAGLGAEVSSVSVDLGDPEAAERLATGTEDALGGVDVLINNAGVPMRRRVQQLTVAELRATMTVNFESPARMTMALLPGMLERDRGVIVNVSSFGGRAAIPAESAYCASKFALSGWSESLAMDLWHTGVAVRLITPGAIATDIWDRPGNDPAHFDGELEPPGTVAAGIIGAIEGESFEHYLPDMSGVVEFKTAAIDDFLAGAVAFADAAENTDISENTGDSNTGDSESTAGH
ncbi:MAG: SDR family NAD(P)-dependent oxidoreductase [Microthrixaceae bacterium]